eukprot:2883619-Rhodomonas_salina.1
MNASDAGKWYVDSRGPVRQGFMPRTRERDGQVCPVCRGNYLRSVPPGVHPSQVPPCSSCVEGYV